MAEVVEKWEKHAVSRQHIVKEREIQMYKSLLMLGVDACLRKNAHFTSEDLCLCVRDNKPEVWTLKDFNKNTLIITPFSTEVKDRYWTYNKSVLCTTGLSQKKLCLDGRLWGRHPPPTVKAEKADTPGSESFSIFWCVGQTEFKKDANLVIEKAELDFRLKIPMPDKKNIVVDGDDLERG